MCLYICVGEHVCWCMYVPMCMQMYDICVEARGQAQVSLRHHPPYFEAGSLTGQKFMD